MGCIRKKAVPICRGAQHTLPSIELAEKQTNTPSISSSSSILSTSSISSFIQMRSNTLTTEHIVIESCLDGSDNNNSDLHDPDISSDNKNLMSPIDDDILENESTHSNFKRKNKETINENANLWKKIYAIGEAIYTAIEKTKYSTNEHLMKIYYDTLLDIKEFKEADITKEFYLKLNQPVNANNDPHYNYLNLIIDRTFADPNTEKNSIAFGMAVALNYFDPSKGISMVSSKVAERMNHILEKMQ
ncbi:5236_t:CDS:2, partial [Cetraspora pellucida]